MLVGFGAGTAGEFDEPSGFAAGETERIPTPEGRSTAA